MAFAHNLTYCKCRDCGEKISITLIRVSKKHSLDAQRIIILAIVRTTLTIFHCELQERLQDLWSQKHIHVTAKSKEMILCIRLLYNIIFAFTNYILGSLISFLFFFCIVTLF